MQGLVSLWRPKSLQRGLAAALTVGALAAVIGALALALAAAPGDAAEPPPDLSGCQVFPNPPAGLSPTAKSLPTQAAWNQDISKAPRAKNSAAMIAYINGHGGSELHPDFGSPRPYGIGYSVVGADQAKLPIHYTEYGAESTPGPSRSPPTRGSRAAVAATVTVT